MAESKEFQLDEPYYGPSILPSRSSARRSRRSRRTDLYSMLCAIVKAASISLIIVGIIVLTLWLVYQPKSIKVDAKSASLSNFSLSPSGPKPLLSYSLALNFTFRNPNRKYSMYYERIVSRVLYGGSTIGSNGYPRLYQSRESAKAVGMRFEGRSALAAGEDYEREKGEGFFRVRVRMDMTLRLKMLLVKSIRFKPSVDCDLRIPAPGNRTSLAAGFAPIECTELSRINDWTLERRYLIRYSRPRPGHLGAPKHQHFYRQRTQRQIWEAWARPRANNRTKQKLEHSLERFRRQSVGQ